MATTADIRFFRMVMNKLSTPGIRKGSLYTYGSLFLLHCSCCSSYKNASFIYQLFGEVLKGDAFDLRVVSRFLNICWDDLTTFVTPEGTTDSVKLFLDFSCRTKHTLTEKGFLSWTDRHPDPHPVNQNLYFGRTHNIPLLLHHGLGLEFSEDFYELLQKSVIHFIVGLSQYSACLEKVGQLPNRKRVFLVLLVIKTLCTRAKTMELRFADNALRLIWRSIPDSFLCRREIFEIFAGFPADFSWLEKVSEHYQRFICEDDFTELGQPRSLAHLSRCKIRQILSLNKELPTGVNKLPIPQKLKTYLLLE